MRRVLVSKVVAGRVELGEAEAHHLRDVLRLGVGAEVEVFDRDGAVGSGRIVVANVSGVTVEVDGVREARGAGIQLVVAAAVPKGGRADWMIEKLSEIGVAGFVPLKTERSVVEMKGSSKNERWNRLAAEAARQSGREGVMRIEGMMEVLEAIEWGRKMEMVIWYFSGGEGSLGIDATLNTQRSTLNVEGGEVKLMVLVGAEGGWSEGEREAFKAAGILGVRLVRSTLRVETAAVVGAGVILSFLT